MERNKYLSRFIILIICLLLVGCKGNIPSALEVSQVSGYSFAQTMIVVANERNRYQSVYTEQIWDVELADGVNTFESYLLKQVQSFLQDMKTMNLLAEKKEIELTPAEEDRLKKVAKQYYEALSEADKSYIKCSENDVFAMYQEYFRANKVVEEMTKDIDLEISDNEAKVIHLYQIEMTDQDAANELYNQLQEENADFKSLAQTYSESSQIERQLGRKEESEAYETVAFSLITGEMSPVLEIDDKYYILYCLNDYDQEATKRRKEDLYTARRSQMFRQLYSRYMEENPIEFQDRVWQTISCKTQLDTTAQNFFTLYAEEFGG